MLKKFGSTFDSEDCLACNPIHYAAMGKQKDLILFFLENRIEPAVQSIFGNVLDILIRKKSLNLVDFVSNIEGVMALDTYYFWRYIPRRSINDSAWTPFHSAAVSGQAGIFEILMRKFPFMPALKKRLGYARFEKSTSAADLVVLEGSSSIKKMLQIEQDTEEYRKAFMKRNWYEKDLSERKELCNAIRYRDIEKVKETIKNQGIGVVFQREQKTKSDKYFGSSEKPNALDFAALVYSLPFFDFLIENRLEIPIDEFLITERRSDLFFNWAFMEVHPRKGTYSWKEIISPTIFRLDLVEGFKYRKTQTWFFFFVTLALFSLVAWLFSIDDLTHSTLLLFLFYLPLFITLIFWFRACAIYDCGVWKVHEEKKPITKKQARASLIGWISLIVFGLYYCYWMYRLFMST